MILFLLTIPQIGAIPFYHSLLKRFANKEKVIFEKRLL